MKEDKDVQEFQRKKEFNGTVAAVDPKSEIQTLTETLWLNDWGI